MVLSPLSISRFLLLPRKKNDFLIKSSGSNCPANKTRVQATKGLTEMHGVEVPCTQKMERGVVPRRAKRKGRVVVVKWKLGEAEAATLQSTRATVEVALFG